jgi:hypothetical protein
MVELLVHIKCVDVIGSEVQVLYWSRALSGDFDFQCPSQHFQIYTNQLSAELHQMSAITFSYKRLHVVSQLKQLTSANNSHPVRENDLFWPSPCFS